MLDSVPIEHDAIHPSEALAHVFRFHTDSLTDDEEVDGGEDEKIMSVDDACECAVEHIGQKALVLRRLVDPQKGAMDI